VASYFTKFHRLLTLLLCGSALIFALPAASLNAGIFTWNGAGGNVNWITGGNWGGSAPTSSNATDLHFAGATNLGTLATPLNSGTTPFTLNSLTFDSGGSSFCLGGSALTFTTGASNSILQSSSSNENIANAITATDNSTVTLTLGGNGSGIVTLAAAITSGTGNRDYALVKSGSSTFCLSGANTYTAGTTVSAGTLQIGTSERLADTGLFTVSGGTFDLQTFNETVGLVTLTSGSIIGTGASTLTGSSYAVQSGSASAILGGTGTLTKTTAGTVTLTGANTYTGTTTISAGVLNIQNSAGLGTTAGSTTVNAGALQLQGGISVGAEALTLNGSGISSDGALRNISSNNSWSGNLTLASASSVASDSGTLTLTGSITNGGFALTLDGVGNITASGAISGTGALVKNGSGTLTLGASNTFSGGATLNGGTTIVISGSLGASASAATINSATLDIAATVSSARNFTLGSATSTILVDPGLTFTATGIFSGTGTLNKTGAGTLALGGLNTYSNGTNVSAGTLQITASERLANGGAVTVSGGTFDLQTFTETVAVVGLTSGSIIGTGTGTLIGSSYGLQSGSVSAILGGTGSLTKSTAGTVTLTGANTYSGGTSINGGVLVVGSSGALGSSGNISFSGGGTLQYTSSNTTDYSARFSNLMSQTFCIDTNAQNVTLGTAFTSTGGTMTKMGAGALTLSGANSYTGSTTVSGGTLQVNVNNALGTNAAGTTVANGAALKLNGVNYSTAEGLTLNGTGVSNNGALYNTGTSTFAGAIDIATNATINAGGGTLNLTGGIAKNGTTLTLAGGGTININGNGITGSSANSDLVVDGTTVVLNTANSYNGPTTVQNSGILQLGASNVLPSSPQTDMAVNTSSIFDMASRNDGVASLAGDSTGTVKNTTIGTTSTLTVNPSTGVSTTFAGVIAGTNSGAQGNMALIKSGAGTLALTGANTFTGSTTINGGTLMAADTTGSALGSTGSITVNSGGTLLLGASDQINNSATVTLHGGTLARGSGNYNEGGTGLVGMGALTLSTTGSHIDFGTGTVGILTFASFSPGLNTLTIDNWTGTVNTQGITGSTDRLIFDSDQASNLGSFSFAGFGGPVTEFALGSGYFEVVPVPEPSTWVSAALSLGGLIFFSSRSRLARIFRRR
jgi:autotransporter-associated beta strand protein